MEIIDKRREFTDPEDFELKDTGLKRRSSK